MSANNERLGEGLRIYAGAMQAWLARTLRRAQGGRGDWFADRVLVRVGPQQRASLENAVSYGRIDPEFRVESVIEPNHMRAIVNGNWRDGCGAAFQGNQTASSWIQEVGDVRNRWAHGGIDDEEQVRRALDSCVQVLSYVDKEAAERVRRLRDGEAPEQPAPQAEPAPVEEAPAALQLTSSADLRSWRDVIQPHTDVQGGKFQQAEFAADLHQVAWDGRSGVPERRRVFPADAHHKLDAGAADKCGAAAAQRRRRSGDRSADRVRRRQDAHAARGFAHAAAPANAADA